MAKKSSKKTAKGRKPALKIGTLEDRKAPTGASFTDITITKHIDTSSSKLG